MSKQTSCYVLVAYCALTGAEPQVLSVYTSKKIADKNRDIYQRSQAQVLEQRGLVLGVLECNLNKVYV